MKHIICDLDGTLALDDHRRHLIKKGGWAEYFEACPLDKLHTPVALILRAMWPTHDIHILTGRSEETESETRRWLQRHNVFFSGLAMRKTEDCFDSTGTSNTTLRPDQDVKFEMCEKIGLNPGNVEFVLEDRDEMVTFWRKQGYICLQVRDEGIIY